MDRIIIWIWIFIFSIGVNAKTYWVFFNDKGNYRKSDMDNIYNELSEKTKIRRAKMGINFALEIDLPVNQIYIDELRHNGIRIISQSRWLNGVAVNINENQKSRLNSFAFVKNIREVAVYRKQFPKTTIPPMPADSFYGYSIWGLGQMDIPKMHSAGYHGEGVRIGLLDSGARLSHKAFDSLNVYAKWDFINDDSTISYEPSEDEPEQDYHGTYVLSVIGGFLPNKVIGPAYKSEYVIAKTEYTDREIIAEENMWVRGIEWAESLGVDIVSSSLGYCDWYSREDMNGHTAITTRVANIASSLGVLVVNSAGNERGTSWNYILAPADAESIISVGAVNQYGEVTSFSSPGPTYDGRIKPDLAGLGLNVVAATAYDSFGVTFVAGTSLSAPLVAGASALLLQANPTLLPMQLKDSLRMWADQFFAPDTDLGWGIPNPYLSFHKDNTIYFRLFDKSTRFPLDTAKFVLTTTDTVCTLYTNLRGIYRYYPAIIGQYKVEYEISQNRYYKYEFDYTGNKKEVKSIYVDRSMPEPVIIYPNPFKDECNILLSEEPHKDVEILIYNVSGDIIKPIKFKTISYRWDGTNINGDRVGEGIYILKISYGGNTYIRKVALIK